MASACVRIGGEKGEINMSMEVIVGVSVAESQTFGLWARSGP